MSEVFRDIDLNMGATASLQPEVFAAAKEEYELKKDAGLSDEELFNHMKAFIETKTAEFEKSKGETTESQKTEVPA